MNKAAFLDRDGVINVDKVYVFLKSDLEWMPGAIDPRGSRCCITLLRPAYFPVLSRSVRF